MFTWFLTALAAQTSVADQPPLLTFSAHPELRHVTTQVEAGVIPHPNGPMHYWFKRTVRPDGRNITETQWTDTRRCPYGRQILEELAALAPMQPFVFGLDGQNDVAITLDGTTYKLDTAVTAPFGGGRIHLQTNVGTPLARWVEASFVRLESCWSTEAPQMH